ncbi:ankyrin repeat-containing domain protein [Halenospora varia]|nr:ankyrin repeat-containing domain protein [Halenospora varia]
MATSEETLLSINIPKLPSAGVKGFIPYLAKNPNTPIGELLEPYKNFEAELRKVFAQEPSHEAVKDPNVNLVPIFNGHEQDVKIRARVLENESEDETSRYIMSLSAENRKKSGSPAIVSSFKDFQQNFNLFSESSLIDLDWNNVVAAGSAVTTSLLPVPEKWAESKRSLREYYHEKLAPASDVDLFLYGLNEEQALEKIKQIERSIKDSILHEVTTIRTKNAITIASQYPTRHVQIVLRLYDSISQIITGFDVDCACAAYDGKQVYAAPRAVASFITQCNTIDLTRRSPSYENRLSKYSHRGFEVYWPLLDRSRVDPTIFERSFGRTQGLARLLILEKLPKTADRDSYMEQRRTERGRPELNRWRNAWRMGGNLKDQEEDEVAEWVEQEEVSSYHSMTVPYGPKYAAAKINRLLYAKDLLLNAEWNQPDDREVHLHRHPCFFGTAEEVLEDCCGFCPVPQTDEEIEVAEQEAKTNISGPLKFLKDDPGRQEIGSFNPITDDEWTTMAYVGDTARLCQAIVEGDLEHVQDWCEQEGVDVNRRDYTGRTPLHLACMASTPEIVQCLIDHGARLIARLVDGRTALHIAAARGNAVMVKALMDKSLENEEEEEEKVEAKREAKKVENASKPAPKKEANESDDGDEDEDGDDDSASEITLDSEKSDNMTLGSFVKIEREKATEDGLPEDSTEDPDVYEIDVIAWDYGLSPLHLAILNGHLDIIELLISEYGADALLPVKLIDPDTKSARGAIMTIVLAMFLPKEKAMKVAKLLLELGATSAQGDMNQFSVLHYVVSQNNTDVLDVLFSNDKPVALSVLNNVGFPDTYGYRVSTPISTAVQKGYTEMVSKLMKIGAKPEISFDDWIKGYLAKNEYAKNQSSEDNMWQFKNSVTQPIINAVTREMAKSVEDMLANGADPNSLTNASQNILRYPHNYSYQAGETVLDLVQKKIKDLKAYKEPESNFVVPEKLRNWDTYMDGLTEGTYKYWSAFEDFEAAKESNKQAWITYEKQMAAKSDSGVQEKMTAITSLIKELENTEKALKAAGAKSFYDAHPEITKPQENLNQGYVYQQPKPEPYKTKLTFQVPDLTDIKRDGYVKLFEAAWNRDAETIKAMTLAPWSSAQEPPTNTPLKIAVKDSNGFSPFSIAILRGHRDLAKQIVGICMAQYHKEDNKGHRQRWNMRTGDSEDGDSDMDDDNVLPIFSELVSDRFTSDNLGEISKSVKSDVLPLTMIEWTCQGYRFTDNDETRENGHWSLPAHAVNSNDMDLLKFIIELGTEQQCLLAEEPDDQRCYVTFDRNAWSQAITLGHTDMLAEIIKATGEGIPLNFLVKDSGVEIKPAKPKYYQGLNVGGKKRADWAQAPGSNVQVYEEKFTPLLRSARAGSVESVEWFMSDAPMRRYKEFAEKNKHDKRIKTLEESGKGFDKTIGTWLSTKSELTLHCAILHSSKKTDTDTHLALIKHLISVVPETLEIKSSEGWTPLHLAVWTQSTNIVSYLISIGANQRSRDKLNRNMLHSMVAPESTSYYSTARTDVKNLKKMITLFDPKAIKEMFLERCNVTPGALTPSPSG